MIEFLIRKLLARHPLSRHEREALAGMVDEVRDCPARTTLVREGEPLEHSMLLLDGFVARHKDVVGGQRQIIEIHVPGDFIDLPAFLLKRLEHDMATLSPARIALVPHARLQAMTEQEPHLSRAMWLSTLVEGAIHRQWIVSNSRRSALSRIAHLFCELRVRMEVVGLGDAGGYPLPITQTDIADATGLTAIHVNRMLKGLREAGVLTFRDGAVTIGDLARLEKVGEFKADYLYLDGRTGV